MSDTRQHLLDNILSIIETLETPPLVDADAPENGPLQDETHETLNIEILSARKGLVFNEYDETWHRDGVEVEAVPMSAYDYISNALSLEYTVDSQRQCLGGEVLVAAGGPNIWIETRYNNVVGAWGSDRITRSYTDNINLDEAVNELWEMGA